MDSEKSAVVFIQVSKSNKGKRKSEDMENYSTSKAPAEALASKAKGFKNLLELATECLSNKDYSNAEMIYGSLFGDLQKEWLIQALNFNDLDCFSLQCCFAYATVASNPGSESSLVILNSLHSPIKIPLVPYLKAFVYISNDSFTSATKEMDYSRKLIDDGYNFKSNSILNEDIIPEINNDFLKLKLNGLKFACELLKSREDNEELKKTFKEHWMKIGKLCEYDFTKTLPNKKDDSKLKEILEKKKDPQVKTGAIKKNENTANKAQKPKTSNIAIQTTNPKHVSVHVQTNEKDFNKEIMSVLIELKNRMNNLQNKKDDEIKKLNKTINELNEKLQTSTDKDNEFDFLKERYFAMEKKYEESQKQVQQLQLLLNDQILQKNQIQKSVYKMYEEKCNNKVDFLADILKLIQPGFKISVDECNQEIQFWKNTLNQVIGLKKKFILYYKNIEENKNKDFSSISTFECPELPVLPFDTQDLIHRQFRNILVNWAQICGTPISLPPSYEKLNPKRVPNFNAAVGSYQKVNEDGRTTGSPAPNNTPYQNGIYDMNPNNGQPSKVQFTQPHRNATNSLFQHFNPFPNANNAARNIPFDNFKPPVSIQNAQIKMPPSQNGVIILSNNFSPNGHMGNSNYWDPGPNLAQIKTPPPNFRPEQQNVEQDTKSYKTEKELVEYLKSKFEHIDEVHLQYVTMRVRDANGGTLEGFSRDKLVEIIRSSLKKDIKTGKPAWNEVNTTSKWQNDHSERRCCICFDDFNPSNSYMLQCQHEFHRQCITDWLKRQSACPVCRVHTVIDEDFPPLNK